MPIHPAPPTDLPGLVNAFAHTGQAVTDLGRGLTDEQLALPTDCPGWTVKDHVSHVVAVESHLEGLPEPHVDVPGYDHVRNDLGHFMEAGVEARRSRAGVDVVRELEYVLGRRVATVGSPGLELDSIVAGMQDRPTTIGELLRMRTMDIWVHEQDIRAALDEPGNLDSPAAAVFVASAVRTVPQAIARRAEVPIGDTVILELTGPVTARIGVRVEDGTEEDPRPHGVVLFGGEPLQILQTSPLNTFALIVVMIWIQTGFAMTVLSAAIKGVPAEIYEAARIDGAGRFRTTVSITLPLIRDNVQTAYIYLGIMALDAYVYMVALNATGGPGNSTLVMSQYLFRTAFEKGQFGLASAMGVVLAVITLIFAAAVFLVNRLTGGKDDGGRA